MRGILTINLNEIILRRMRTGLSPNLIKMPRKVIRKIIKVLPVLNPKKFSRANPPAFPFPLS